MDDQSMLGVQLHYGLGQALAVLEKQVGDTEAAREAFKLGSKACPKYAALSCSPNMSFPCDSAFHSECSSPFMTNKACHKVPFSQKPCQGYSVNGLLLSSGVCKLPLGCTTRNRNSLKPSSFYLAETHPC